MNKIEKPNPDEYFFIKVTETDAAQTGLPEGALALIHMQNTAEPGKYICIYSGDTVRIIRHTEGSNVDIIGVLRSIFVDIPSDKEKSPFPQNLPQPGERASNNANITGIYSV